MTDESWMAKTGATPGKLALTAVLALVLAYVIGIRLVGDSTPASVAASEPLQTSRRIDGPHTRSNSSPPRAPSKAAAPETPTWPELSIADVVRNDPMALPPWFEIEHPQTVPSEIESQATASAVAAQAARQQRNAIALDELRQKGATIVVLAEGDEVAAIGEQRVRVGDTIEGFQITDITKRGVVVTEIPQR